jgi:hypothetical protein
MPEDSAFTHIGFMLAWLVVHDLADPEFLSAEIVRQLRERELFPNDLSDFTDGKLMSDMLVPEGSAFLDAYYSSYLADYASEFADLPQYGVPDDAEHQARIDKRIDGAYSRWIDAGRPGGAPDPHAASNVETLAAQMAASMTGHIVLEYSGPPDLLDLSKLPPGIEVKRVEPKRYHVDPELERRVTDAIAKPMDLDSLPASRWGSATLSRALRNLGADPRKSVMVAGMGDQAEPVVEVHCLPGITTDQLQPHFRRYYENRVGGRWRDSQVGALSARVSVQVFVDKPHVLVWFAVDGYAAYLGSRLPESEVLALAERLQEALGP